MPQQSTNQNEMPGLTPERNLEAGIRDSFPASDAASSTAGQGSRAVPPQRLMDRRATSEPPRGSLVVEVRFRDREAAKLALESLVREGPLDRRHAELMPADETVTLRLQAPVKDAPRLGDLLRKQGGAIPA